MLAVFLLRSMVLAVFLMVNVAGSYPDVKVLVVLLFKLVFQGWLGWWRGRPGGWQQGQARGDQEGGAAGQEPHRPCHLQVGTPLRIKFSTIYFVPNPEFLYANCGEVNFNPKFSRGEFSL